MGTCTGGRVTVLATPMTPIKSRLPAVPIKNNYFMIINS
jgi:hypothetical protein